MSLIPPLYGFPPTLWVSWVLIFVAHGGGICSARMRAYSQLLSPGSLIRNLLRANEGLLLVHHSHPHCHIFPQKPIEFCTGGGGVSTLVVGLRGVVSGTGGVSEPRPHNAAARH